MHLDGGRDGAEICSDGDGGFAGQGEGRGGEERIAATEGIEGGLRESGDVLASEARGPGFAGSRRGFGGFECEGWGWDGLLGGESNETIGAHGDDGVFGRELFEEPGGDHGEAFKLELHGFADFVFAGADEIDALHVAQASAAAGDVSGEDVHEWSQFAAHGSEHLWSKEAQVKVGDDGGIAGRVGRGEIASGFGGGLDDVILLRCIEEVWLDEIDLHELLLTHEESLFFREHRA